MPRYFFHILNQDSSIPIPDDEGEIFEDHETARQEAMASLRDLAIDALKCGGKIDGFAIQIADEAGKIVETIRARQTFG